MYSSATLTNLYGISRETVRQWVNEFKEYLSPGATPSAGRQRIFNDSDMRVFALIHEMKGRGALYEDIHAALKTGQRGDLPSTLHSLVPGGATDSRALGLRKELEQVKSELVATRQKLQEVMESDTKRAGQVDELRIQLESAYKTIERLNREIGRLEARGDIG